MLRNPPGTYGLQEVMILSVIFSGLVLILITKMSDLGKKYKI